MTVGVVSGTSPSSVNRTTTLYRDAQQRPRGRPYSNTGRKMLTSIVCVCSVLGVLAGSLGEATSVGGRGGRDAPGGAPILPSVAADDCLDALRRILFLPPANATSSPCEYRRVRPELCVLSVAWRRFLVHNRGLCLSLC